jgi:uncharacterized protein (DUF302 family)
MDAPRAQGVVSKRSASGLAETVARLKEVVSQRGLTLFAEIDHQANAQSVDLQMQPATVLIFGNARAGTPLMVASPLMALDLPLRTLVWEDAKGGVWVSYNSPAYLAERYGIADDVIKNIAAVDVLVDAALLA